MNEATLSHKLAVRKNENALRELRVVKECIDLSSNDYLGIATQNKIRPSGQYSHGSRGSRLLSGNYDLITAVEREISRFHDSDCGIIFNSGYDANIGLLSCVPQKGDIIFYDQLSHASIRDGIRLSFADAYSFIHNSIEDLRIKMERISQSGKQIYVVTESVFSMDGDLAPLEQLVDLCDQFKANLVVDEAHATGVVGPKGEGLVQLLGLQKHCFARIHTFGKGCGVHGAIILGSQTLQDYLINFCRSFVYTTALPESSIAAIKAAYTIFPEMNRERLQLKALISYFQDAAVPFIKLKSETPIQGIIIPGNKEVKRIAALLLENNLDVRPILYPTVPKGSERLRIVLHAFNTIAELDALCKLLSE